MTLLVRILDKLKHCFNSAFPRLFECVQYNTHPIDSLTGPIDPSKNLQLTEVKKFLVFLPLTMDVDDGYEVSEDANSYTDDEVNDDDDEVSDWERSL